MQQKRLHSKKARPCSGKDHEDYAPCGCSGAQSWRQFGLCQREWTAVWRLRLSGLPIVDAEHSVSSGSAKRSSDLDLRHPVGSWHVDVPAQPEPGQRQLRPMRNHSPIRVPKAGPVRLPLPREAREGRRHCRPFSFRRDLLLLKFSSGPISSPRTLLVPIHAAIIATMCGRAHSYCLANCIALASRLDVNLLSDRCTS